MHTCASIDDAQVCMLCEMTKNRRTRQRNALAAQNNQV
jgi:hypothetical protein